MVTRCLRWSYCQAFFLSAMLFSLFASSLAESMFTDEQVGELDQFIENIMSCRSTPGLVLSIVRGEETFTKAYGKADVKNNIGTTTDSIFCVASLTKAFTSTLLANILPKQFPETVWDTRVRDILGDEFRFVDDVRTQLTTVKDLLSHRTGLMRGDLGIYGGYPYTVTREEMVHRLKHLEARYEFRDRMLYNNWMYMLAGYIAEVLSGGTSWEELIVRQLLRPLGMNSTIFLDDVRHYVNTTLALPYRVVDGEFHPFPLEHYSFHPEQPAASICSTGNDMIKWMQFLLKIKTFGIANLVNTSAFQATMTPHMVMDRYGLNPPLPGNPHSYGFGFGWIIGSYRGQRLINHAGALLASSSVLWLLPSKKIGIFVAANRQARDPVLGLIGYYLSDIASGETPWLNLTTSCSFPAPWRDVPPPAEYSNKTHAPQRPLVKYTGTYGNKLFGDIQVFIRHRPEPRLEIQYGEHFEGVLLPSEASDTFSVKFTGVYWFLTDRTPIPDALSFIESESQDGTLQYLTFLMQQEVITFNRCVRFNGYNSSATQTLSFTTMFSCISLFLVVWQLWLQEHFGTAEPF